MHDILAEAEVVDRVHRETPMTELERMRLQSEERSYQHMVRGIDALRKVTKNELKESQTGMRFATNFATQVIVAFIGAFALGYFFVEVFVSEDNQVMKVLAGAACSFLTLLLESTLFVVHEEKEQRKRSMAAKATKPAAARAPPTPQTAVDGEDPGARAARLAAAREAEMAVAARATREDPALSPQAPKSR